MRLPENNHDRTHIQRQRSLQFFFRTSTDWDILHWAFFQVEWVLLLYLRTLVRCRRRRRLNVLCLASSFLVILVSLRIDTHQDGGRILRFSLSRTSLIWAFSLHFIVDYFRSNFEGEGIHVHWLSSASSNYSLKSAKTFFFSSIVLLIIFQIYFYYLIWTTWCWEAITIGSINRLAQFHVWFKIKFPTNPFSSKLFIQTSVIVRCVCMCIHKENFSFLISHYHSYQESSLFDFFFFLSLFLLLRLLVFSYFDMINISRT